MKGPLIHEIRHQDLLHGTYVLREVVRRLARTRAAEDLVRDAPCLDKDGVTIHVTLSTESHFGDPVLVARASAACPSPDTCTLASKEATP